MSNWSTWAVVEILGHQRFAGFLCEETLAGSAMLRLDVPAVAGLPAFTRYFSGASVYSITPTTEELAREVAAGLKKQPVNVYDLPEELRNKLRSVPAITGPSSGDDEDYSDDQPWDDDDDDD